MLVLLAILKICATAVCYASGNAGGIFGPSLFIGAMTGGAVGSVAHHFFPAYTAEPGAYALVGMGTAFAGIVRTPMTSVIMIFEITREACAEAKIGISQMDWGKADTGTLVQDATEVEKRLVSTLPLIHIALVATGKILPDLPALLTVIDPRKMGYIAFITGPSRTADIERVLTIGVHGPQRLIIVAVDELGGNL